MARMRLIRMASVVAAALIALVLAGTQAFAAPPTVTSISPNSGSTSGQTPGPGLSSCNLGVNHTTITGTGFTGVTSATIGGSAATILSSDDTTIIVCVPVGVAGVADVLVFTPGGNSGSSGQSLYTYFAGGPSVSNISPAFGLTQGGDTVFISGSNFVPGTGPTGTPATSVFFGANQAAPADVEVQSTGSLKAKVPPGAAGQVSVTVTTAGGSGGGASYLYVAPAQPILTSISPDSGPTLGGTSVTIKGLNFIGTNSVTFDDKPASFIVKTNGEIATTSPVHLLAGPVVVAVTVPGGGTGTGTFTYVTPRPIVTSITPPSGSIAGGTPVTISGQYFTGATAVTIGGIAATDVMVIHDPNPALNDTKITAKTAAHAAGTFDVSVTTPSGTATGPNNGPLPTYIYGAAPPTVTSISPPSGSVDGQTPVIITGTGFTGVLPGGVKIGGTAATSVTVNSDTSITATTPAHAAGTVNVTVSRCDSTCPPDPLKTGTGGVFTYTASLPTVTAVSPNSGSPLGGTLITIMGTNFSGQPLVTVGGVQAKSVAVISATEIRAETPAGTGTKDVVVTTSFGTSPTSAADQFTYTALAPPVPPAPTVTTISPSSGTTLGGTPVIITGTDFTGATSVSIGGNPATNVVVVGSTTITAITPAGTLGVAKDVVVTTPGGTGTGTGLYTYVTVPPTVTAISPNTGSTLGGTAVTITGTNLTGATSVTIGGTPATVVTVLNANTITAMTPAGTGTNVPIVVTTSAGSSTPANLYTYVTSPPPTVTAISPNFGNTAGNTSVTITGTNFTGATSVTIGGTAAAFVTVVSATSITAMTPAHAAGVVDVVVTTPAGTGTGTGLFTYFAVPTVTGITPNSGLPAGGTIVTITGTNFTGATAVKFGGTAATAFTVNSPTSITATSPPGSGTMDVTVTTPGGTSTTGAAGQFIYNGLPTVTAVSPNTGVPGGGATVTITGTNFTGATAVKFGGTAATSFTVSSATSITATSPAGTNTVDITVTTNSGTSATSAADRFTYAKAFTSMVFTSSPNPSVVGQPVTFTATITGNSPTGEVTFSYNGHPIGTGTLSAAGVATFTIASLPAGSNPITASYPGDANNEPDPVTVNQIVNGVPFDSINLRRMQLAVMPIVANLSGQAISGAIDNAIGIGFGGDPQALAPNASGVTYYFDAEPQRNPLADQAGIAITPALASDQARLNADFEALLGYAKVPRTPPFVAPAAPHRRWLVWIDVRGADFGRTSSNNDLKGMQLNAIAGVTHRFTPDFMIGVLGGYEQFNFNSQAYNGVLKGNGWTGGAFLGWRLGLNLRFEAAAAWSKIVAANTSGTASGDFTGDRWFASSKLTGTHSLQGLMLEPSAQVYALWETEKAYTDSLGTLQASRSFYTGRASGGLKVSYPFVVGAGNVAPYAGLYGDYYLSKDNATIDALTTVPLIQGWGARAIGGVATTFDGGGQLSAGGEFSGIGSNTHIWTYRVRGYVPF